MSVLSMIGEEVATIGLTLAIWAAASVAVAIVWYLIRAVVDGVTGRDTGPF